MNDHFAAALEGTVKWLEANVDDITGVIITSAKKATFSREAISTNCARQTRRTPQPRPRDQPYQVTPASTETLGKPVDRRRQRRSPGRRARARTRHSPPDRGGGCLQPARRVPPEVAAEGELLPEAAASPGPFDSSVFRMHCRRRFCPRRSSKRQMPLSWDSSMKLAPVGDLVDRAKDWIKANPEAAQPWDVKGFKMPGGSPTSPSLGSMLPALPALLRRQTKGAPMPARVLPSPQRSKALMSTSTRLWTSRPATSSTSPTPRWRRT